MEEKQLHIKNMVCPRCIMAVRDILQKLDLEVQEVALGHAKVLAPDDFSFTLVESELKALGFELLKTPDQQLTEEIRLKIQEYIRLTESEAPHVALSVFLTETLNKNYTALSKHFAKQYGQTIENYAIHYRIERVKELLDDNELNLSQIADKLNYSSVHYLSGQFKKVTGFSVSEYKASHNARNPLDEI